MDIFNNEKRKIICIDNNNPHAWGGNGVRPLLNVGEEYTLIDVEVHDWYTLVTIEEFPNMEFNSVLFEEID